MKRWALTLFALLAFAPLRAQEAGGVIVHVTGVPDARGHVRVAICGRADFLHEHCDHDASAPSVAGTTTLRILNVPPGVYAVQAWHDANDNQKIDRNWLGLPTEALGFSRDAPMRFGPPRFDDAAVAIGSAGAEISFQLRKF